MPRQITKADATRKKHLKECAGYEDCNCFSSLWSHAEIYLMQQRIAQLREALLSLPRVHGSEVDKVVTRALAADDEATK